MHKVSLGSLGKLGFLGIRKVNDDKHVRVYRVFSVFVFQSFSYPRRTIAFTNAISSLMTQPPFIPTPLKDF